MRGKNWLAVLVRVVCLVILMVACVAEVYGSSTGIQSQTPKKSQSDDISDSNQNDTDIAQELLNEIELTDVQNMLDELLGEDSFSMKDALIKLTKGEQAFSKEAVQGVVYRFFFYRLEQERGLLVKLLLLVLFAAVFSSFADVFENEQVGNISFFVVYLLVFTLLTDSFSEMSLSLEKTIDWMTEVMKGLAPAFYMTVCASSGAASAAVFYEGVLILVWLIQWLLATVILPVCPFTARKLPIKRRNARKNGRIPQHGDLLEPQNTPRDSGRPADHPKSGCAGHGQPETRTSRKGGRGTSGSRKRRKYGDRAGCDKRSPDPKLSWRCDTRRICTGGSRTDAALWCPVAFVSLSFGGITADLR